MYGVKCSKCGLMQLPRPTCKKCGAALEAPREAPPRALSKVPPKVPLRAPPEAPPSVSPKVPPTLPPEVPLTVPFEVQLEDQIGNVPSEDQTAERVMTGTSRCSECGLVFREDELIRFGDSLVCAGCKPLFVQKLREGVAISGEMVYGGFWIRFGAKIIDGIILGVINFLLSFAGGLIGGRGGGIFANVLSWALSLAYTIYFLGAYSATPGKMACGLKVMRPDGERISYGRACGRFFAELLSSVILGIGYIMAAFDEEKRALHDRICDTRVVKKA